MNLLDLFDLSLIGRRDEPALEFERRAFTFGEIDSRSSRMAEALRRRGIDTGDRLCVYLANCVEMIDLYLACLKLGAIFVPINILYRDREIAHIVADAEPKAVVTRGALEAAPPVWQVSELPGDAPPLARRAALDGDAPAALVYTSGTTGASKGAILTHNNFAANAINLLTCWQMTPADRLLLALPLFHVHALGNGLHCWLIGGFRMRLLERFERRKGRRRVSGFPSHRILRRANYVRPPAGNAAGHSARNRPIDAPVRFRIGPPAPASARRFPRALRPYHPRTLRHERDAHEHEQSLQSASGVRAA